MSFFGLFGPRDIKSSLYLHCILNRIISININFSCWSNMEIKYSKRYSKK